MLAKAVLQLRKAAKSRGGDRYDGVLNLASKGREDIDIYIPQFITRVDRTPVQYLSFSIFETKPSKTSGTQRIIKTRLASQAKSQGGDKYDAGLVGPDDEKFTPYVPQSVSRNDGIPRSVLYLLLDGGNESVGAGSAAAGHSTKSVASEAGASGSGAANGKKVDYVSFNPTLIPV